MNLLKKIITFFSRKKWYLEKKTYKIGKKYKKIFPPSKHKIKTLVLDTSNYHTEMCDISMKLDTDKSPFNISGHYGHRHAYTGIYHYLFKDLREKNLDICEIGVQYNKGAKLFREYFKKSKLYCFDFEQIFLENAKKDNLFNVEYNYMDVRNAESIIEAFEKVNVKYDIIFEDSSHLFNDQVKVIENAHLFMKKNSTLIIEDIFRDKKGYSELDYFNSLKNSLSYYSDYYFIESRHRNEWSILWNNSKILVLKKD
tara:strand:+ start:241 stop:1005 length:765 start_codon:yes stop_codon:yes gene_type:complete